jgi:hypothetical protein
LSDALFESPELGSDSTFIELRTPLGGGDTLVVHAIGRNDRTFVDGYRTPHTTQLNVVERFKITDGGKTLDVSFTADDPATFYKPWARAVPVFGRSLRTQSEYAQQRRRVEPGLRFGSDGD